MIPSRPLIAIVDYGLGNLYSVQRACEQAGMEAYLAARAEDLKRAEGVILPGVGAFGDAMASLRREGMDGALREVVQSGKPLLGICLGIQLLMTESQEFGRHEGLGIVPGTVVRFEAVKEGARSLKVPQICWNGIRHPAGAAARGWEGTPLEGLPQGEPMYFVHSYYVKPRTPDDILSTTQYGEVEFCSGLRVGNVFAFQFHPERSGPSGLRIYRNFAEMIRT